MTFNLPFFFTYGLLQYANAPTYALDPSFPWSIQYAISLMLLLLLAVDGLVIFAIFLVGSTLACILFALTSDTIRYEQLNVNVIQFLPSYIFILVTGTIFNRNREIIEQEKLSTMANIGSNIAHELRTPLLGIRATAQGLQRYLPTLLKAYHLALDNKLGIQAIRVSHLKSLTEGLKRIETETTHSNTIIDMLLVNSTEQPLQDGAIEQLSAHQSVQEAIERFPFDGKLQRELVNVKYEQDFSIAATPLLIIHVLFNLIKNALYYIEKSGKGQIYISFKQGTHVNQIIFEDTGMGIATKHISQVFERFFTTSDLGKGSGIGLSFCKMVMHEIQGEIRCESQLGVFTRFHLDFPKVKDD
ncbi:MAG: HAMP domain-containing histidine kinase [Pseudomonadales bacterium]|nr:HAMP domain-containing histidine kinase [Pseudomonadales bacterium]